MTDSRTLFGRILNLIPGYSGYASRQEQRQSDSLLRWRISDLLTQCQRSLEVRLEEAVDIGDAEQADALERVRKRLDTLATRTRYAPLGQSGLMSEHPVGEAELQRLMKLDLELMETVSELAERIDRLGPPELLTVLERLTQALAGRNRFLQEYK